MPTAAQSSVWSRQYKEIRRDLKEMWQRVNAPCSICGLATIDWDGPKNAPESFELEHTISRQRAMAMNRPDLFLDPGNMGPSHCRCNRAKGAGDSTPPLGETSEEY